MNWQPGWKPIGEPSLDPPDDTYLTCVECKEAFNSDDEGQHNKGVPICGSCYHVCEGCGLEQIFEDDGWDWEMDVWYCDDCKPYEFPEPEINPER